MAKKIAFIGAGSFGFTRELVKDLLTFPAFQDAEMFAANKGYLPQFGI